MADELDDFLAGVIGKPLPKPSAPKTKPNIDAKIDEYSSKNGVDPAFVRAVMGQESGGNPNAKSWANAKGLMQIVPDTGKRYVKNFDPYNVDHNLEAGTKYLADLEKRYKGDKKRALAAYNAGEGNADKSNWYEQSKFWSNDPDVQKGLKPRGASDKTNTRNYIDKIYGNYEKLAGQSKDPLDTFLSQFVTSPDAAPINAGSIRPLELKYATPDGLSDTQTPQVPSPTVQGTQTLKDVPAPTGISLDGGDGNKFTQDVDQKDVAVGEVRVKNKEGKAFIAKKQADNRYSIAPEVKYSPEEVESGYKEYLGFTKEADSPETKAKYLEAIKGNVSTATIDSVGIQTPSLAGAGAGATLPRDEYAQQVDRERTTRPDYYFTQPKQQVVKEIKTDDDYLRTSAGAVAIDISRKPNGQNLGEYLLRTALKANQPKYGYSDQDIERVVESKRGIGFTEARYPDFRDDEYSTTVLDYRRKHDGSPYINMSLTRGIVNEALGGNSSKIADVLASERPTVVQEIQNPYVLPDSAMRMTENDAKAKTIADLQNPTLSAQFEEAAKKVLGEGGAAWLWNGAGGPIGLAYYQIGKLKEQYDLIGREVPSQQEKLRNDLLEIKNSFGSFSDYQKIQAYKAQMTNSEYGLRFGTNILRSAVRTAVADTLKGIEAIGALLEDATSNPQSSTILSALPEKFRPSIRNVGNLLAYAVGYVRNPNLKYEDLATASSDIDQRLFYQLGKNIDESLGDDKYLRGTFGDALSQGLGSGLGFMLMGMIAPEASIGGRFALSSAALGALTSAGSGYSEAKQSGLTETQAKTYALINGIAGASEGFGVGSSVVRAIKDSNLRRMLLFEFASFAKAKGKDFLEGGAEEGLQEFFQSTVGAAALKSIQDKEPTAAGRIRNILNNLPSQMADAAVTAVPTAFLTGGLMDAGVKTISEFGNKDEGFQIDEKNRRLKIDGVTMTYDESLSPTIKAWRRSQNAIEDAQGQISDIAKEFEKSKTPEQKITAYQKLLRLEKEIDGLSAQNTSLLHTIATSTVPIAGESSPSPLTDIPESATVAPEMPTVEAPPVVAEPIQTESVDVPTIPTQIVPEVAKPVEPVTLPKPVVTEAKTPITETKPEPVKVSQNDTPKEKTAPKVTKTVEPIETAPKKINRVALTPKAKAPVAVGEAAELPTTTKPKTESSVIPSSFKKAKRIAGPKTVDFANEYGGNTSVRILTPTDESFTVETTVRRPNQDGTDSLKMTSKTFPRSEYKSFAADLVGRISKGETNQKLIDANFDGKVQTIVSSKPISLAEFENESYDASEVTRSEWVNLQRANLRRLGQAEESGTRFQPYGDFENYHRDRVEEALKKGDEVDEEVLADYPDLVKKYKQEDQAGSQGQQVDSETANKFNQGSSPTVGDGATQPQSKSVAQKTEAATTIKQPFEMTRMEFRDVILTKNGLELVNMPEWLDAHKKAVQEAIAQNKSVPAKVLADYPELTKQKKTEEPATTADTRAAAIEDRMARGISKDEQMAEDAAKEKEHVQTETDVEALPKSQQVSPNAEKPTVKEAKESVKDEKIHPRTGLTKTQTEFLAKELQELTHEKIKELGWDLSEFPEGLATFTLTGVRWDEAEFIKVPGDGQFKVDNIDAANRLHHKITGKPIQGLAATKKVSVNGTTSQVLHSGSAQNTDTPTSARLAVALYGTPELAVKMLTEQKRLLDPSTDQDKKNLQKLDDVIANLENSYGELVSDSGVPFTTIGREAKEKADTESAKWIEGAKERAAKRFDDYQKFPDFETAMSLTQQDRPKTGKGLDIYDAAAQSHERELNALRELLNRSERRPPRYRDQIENEIELTAKAIIESANMMIGYSGEIRKLKLSPNATKDQVLNAIYSVIGRLKSSRANSDNKTWFRLHNALKQLQTIRELLESIPTDQKETAPVETVDVAADVTQQAEPENIIGDYGEKIGGAKKDIYKRLEQVSTDDIRSQPLSKSFPQPDYNQLIADGIIDERGAKLIKFFYDAIPAKPRKSYKLDRWVQSVQTAIQNFKDIVSKPELAVRMEEKIRTEGSYTLQREYKNFLAIADAFGFPKNPMYSGSYEISHFGRAMLRDGKERRDSYAITSGSIIIKEFDTLEAAAKGLKEIADNQKDQIKEIKFNVYQDRKTKEYFIGKKGAVGVVRVMENFKSSDEAFKFLKNNQQQLETIWEGFKAQPQERRQSNRSRVGNDWRKGKNIDEKNFANTFGFRAVEFGNWVNNAERQKSVNDAYDSLMDMASILQIDPKAISLNGTLALAFGARGSGGKNSASAHFEPDRTVINLTKISGAGSLGHEWWHSLDNYFSRMRNDKSGFVTTSPRAKLVKAEGTWAPDTSIRTEMLDAFKGVVDAINKSGMPDRSEFLDQARSKAYWSTIIEMSARSFENYLIEKLAQNDQFNDYLANFKDTSQWLTDSKFSLDNYPYPLKEETAINDAFETLFSTLEQEETDAGVMLKSVADASGNGVNLEDLYNENGEFNYEQVSNVAERIRSGSLKIERLDNPSEQGRIRGGQRNVEASIIIGASENAVQKSSAKSGARVDSHADTVKRQEQVLENYAKRNDIWFKPGHFPDRFYLGRGGESVVYFKDANRVVKLLDYQHIDKSLTPQKFLDDRIAVFNALFPATHYELMGLMRDGQGKFRFVVTQTLIQGDVTKTQADIDDLMDARGFERTGKESYSNSLYQVHDLHVGNVLKSEAGTIFVIDAVPKFNGERSPFGLVANAENNDNDSILKSVADIDATGITLDRNSKGEILAPNGKVSNIQNEDLAKKIRTPEFKKWFGDWINDPENASKVVDENGEPLKVFRGDVDTATMLEDFTLDQARGYPLTIGYHFTDTITEAESFASEFQYNNGRYMQKDGAITPVFLNIREPLEIRSPRPNTAAGTVDIQADQVKKEAQIQGKDGIVSVSTDRRYPGRNFITFQINQIKSIFNEGTFSNENDSILKQVSSTDRKEQERLQTVPTHELFDGTATFDGENVSLDLKASENLRRHIAELSFRSKGQETDELAFDGLTLPRNAMKSLQKVLQETYDTAISEDFGYTAEEMAGHKSLLDAITKLADETPVGVMYVFADALPEELFHKEDLLSGRTDAEALGRIGQSELWNIANEKGSRFNREYGTISANNRLSELVAKLATGQEEKYGFVDAFESREAFEDARDNLLVEWAEGILRKNPNLDLSKFERINKYVEISKAKRETGSESAIVPDTGNSQEEQGQSQEPVEGRKSDQQSQSSAETEAPAQSESDRRRSDGRVSQGEDSSKEKTPAYAEKSLSSDAVTYEQESMKETQRKGEALTRAVGISDIIEQVKFATGNLPAQMAAIYAEQSRLNTLADDHKANNRIAEYNATIDQLRALSTDIISAQIQSGRAVNIAKTLEPLSAENAINVLTRLKQKFTGNENESLTPKEAEQVKKLQDQISEATKNLNNKSSQISRLKKKIQDIYDGKYVMRPQKTLSGKTVRVSAVQERITTKLEQNYDDLLAQLKLDIENEILKMVAPSQDLEALKAAAPARLPADSQDAVSQVGAKILNDGLTSGQPFDDKDFARQIRDILGPRFVPFTDEIIALSYDKLIEIKREALKERLVEAFVAEGNSQAQAKILAEKELEDRKERSKTKAQSVASIRKIANRARKHQTLLKNLESVTDDKNVVHAGVILAETKGLSVNSLINQIQSELGLTPGEALSAARQAKAAIVEVNDRLKAERDEARGLLPEALKAEAEARVAQRQATAHMNSLLKTVTDDSTLMKRFNNDFRAKLVLNHATQLFNIVQSATPIIGTMSTEIYTDLWDTAIRGLRRKLGKTNELDDVAPSVGPLTALLPYKYLFAKNRQIAEGILSEFPDEYFRLELGILPDVNLNVADVRGNNPISRGAHKWFDANQNLNEKMATITGAKLQEAHFRSLTFLATLDQLARNKGTTLKDVLATGRASEFFSEDQVKNAVDKALRVTFAEQMDDRIGRSLKRSYDKMDHYLPVLLNPAVYARFTYTVARGVINAHTFGALDAKSFGGHGYNTRSFAKGIHGMTMIGMGYALLAAFGGDDDKWYNLYFNGKDSPPIDIRRFFPISAYVFTANLIRRKMEGRDILEGKTLGDKFAELSESYASLDVDQFGRGPSMQFLKSLDSDTEGSTTKAAARVAGNFVASFLRFFRPIKLLVSQIDQDEATYRNYGKTAEDAFVGEMAKNIPFLTTIYGADKKLDPITQQPVKEIMPLARMIGLNFVNPLFTSPKPTPATESAEKLFPYEGAKNEMTPEQLEAYQIRREIKERVRKGELLPADVEPLIKEYTANGKLTKGSAALLTKSLALSDLQEVLKARFSFSDEKDVKKLRTVWDASNPVEQAQIIDVLKKKLATAQKAKDVKAVERAKTFLAENDK